MANLRYSKLVYASLKPLLNSGTTPEQSRKVINKTDVLNLLLPVLLLVRERELHFLLQSTLVGQP